MARRRRPQTFAAPESREESLCRGAFRSRRKGDDRRALLLLREAAYENEYDARVWALYGAQCARIGRRDAAAEAFRHAVWLRERAGQCARADVTRRLLRDVTGDGP